MTSSTHGASTATVAALPDRQRQPRVNHKRVYRIMRQKKLLLPKHTDRIGRAHDGKVLTPVSTMRWWSDSFEIQCWSGERVHVAFALDCCDREVLGWVVNAQHLLGESRQRGRTERHQPG